MAQIKKDTSLRKAILQATITGQLISSVVEPVETTTETGKQLLDRIIEERNKKLLAEWEEALKKNPKAKKPAPVVASEIDEDEIPFEIPENWCWCRLGDICNKIGDIDHRMPKEIIDGIPYISPKDFTETDIDFSKAKKISQEDFDDLSKKMKPQKGDIIFPRYGTIGTVRLINVDFKFLVSYSCCTISTMRKLVSEVFVFYALQSKHIKEEIEKYINKTTQPNVGLESIKQFLFPLPPLAVQNAIVAKLEQVLPLVDAYENAVLQKEELKSTLSEKVKKAILQEAITGKLTESWRKEMLKQVQHDGNCHPELDSGSHETGKQLLDRIIKERNAKALADWEEKLKTNPKAKKPVPVVASEIEEDEIPFEVPESWCWCRLGDVFEKITDGTHKTPKYLPSGVPFLSVKDMSSGKLDFSHTKFISEEEHNELYKRCNPERGDLLITKVGTTGIPVIVDTDKIFDLFVSVALCKPVGNILDMQFLVAFINSPFVQEQIDRDTIGSANKNWVIDKIVNTILPLPPLEEQEEIVQKLEELLTLCK